jgi:glyoxylase-like metal-dependent hydrolase (beta-lactamase superfamily II)
MTIRIGAAQIRRAEEMVMQFPIKRLTRDASILDANADWLTRNFYDPATQSLTMVFHTWIVEIDGLTVVVDPCNGNGRSRPGVPFFEKLDTPFLERFEAQGVRPEDVDVVFCTHLHCDHCGWNTQLRDGRWTPTFPNARYLFVRREVERWDPRRPGHSPVAFNAGVFDDSVRPILDAGLAELVEDRHRVSPSLAIEPSWGHTFGHSTLRLSSAGDAAFFTGDAFHHPLQVVRPDLNMDGGDDVPMAGENRARLVREMAELGAMILPAHFPDPYCGRVRKAGAGYRFEAYAPEGAAA